jgi:hypothetical protein
MRSRNLVASVLTACLLTVGFSGVSSMATGASAAETSDKPNQRTKHHVRKAKRHYEARRYEDHRFEAPRAYLPVGPSYLFHDYPYYYSRGYYPTHVGPHVVYYGFPGGETTDTPSYSARCAHWHRQCVANWGDRNDDYAGCMGYHHCE